VGIDKRHHKDIFKMFVRLHTKQEEEGSGTGLAVCKKIVDKHGGQIGVESKVGAGSTFWFTLSESKNIEQEQDGPVST
jgi:light-regulated signal transduction histidine kinase (bacteriophytochrome)